MSRSRLLLVGIVALGVGARTFSFTDLSGYRLAETSQVLVALLVLAAFAIRPALFPLHAWLARTFVTAPVPVAVVLGGIVSKTALYATARIWRPLFRRGVTARR